MKNPRAFATLMALALLMLPACGGGGGGGGTTVTPIVASATPTPTPSPSPVVTPSPAPSQTPTTAPNVGQVSIQIPGPKPIVCASPAPQVNLSFSSPTQNQALVNCSEAGTLNLFNASAADPTIVKVDQNPANSSTIKLTALKVGSTVVTVATLENNPVFPTNTFTVTVGP